MVILWVREIMYSLLWGAIIRGGLLFDVIRMFDPSGLDLNEFRIRWSSKGGENSRAVDDVRFSLFS